MFWTDAGTVPKIETSWMDGSERKAIVKDKLGVPASIVIDFQADHRLYWCDSKLNSIESSNKDGSDRVVIMHSEAHHPISLEIFEDQIYWTTKDTNEIYRQDKFGRGVKVRVKRASALTTDLKIFHRQKYNTSCE